MTKKFVMLQRGLSIHFETTQFGCQATVSCLEVSGSSSASTGAGTSTGAVMAASFWRFKTSRP